MIKIVFSFKCIHTYACVTCYFLNNLINNLFFCNKIMFKFKYMYVFA